MRRAAVASLLGVAIAACAPGRTARSYLPVGAGALYGDGTGDGVAFTLALSAPVALDTVAAALRRAGYEVEPSRSNASFRTAPHLLGGDTSMVVIAEVTSL